MKYYYEIIINGFLQEAFMPFVDKENALKVIQQWRADGRLKNTDKAVIRTTIIIEDEI